MSSLFKAYILTNNDDNSVLMTLEATNHQDQLVQTDPIFYFAIIGSIYWEMNENIDGYSYGFVIDEPYPIPNISYSIPMLDHYVNWGKIQLGEDVENFEEFVESPYPENLDIDSLLSITVENEQKNKNGAVEARLRLNSTSTELIDILKMVKKVSISFDQDYLSS